jgi:hypothetical protein
MNYIQRLQIEIQSIELPQEQLKIYLEENGITDPFKPYNPQSNNDKRAIYKTALSVLESIANDPKLMKNYKQEDMSISGFAESLQARIDQLEKKIRNMPLDESADSSFFMLFNN